MRHSTHILRIQEQSKLFQVMLCTHLDINITKIVCGPKEQPIIFILQTFMKDLCKRCLWQVLQRKKQQPCISWVAQQKTGCVSAEENGAEKSRTQVN